MDASLVTAMLTSGAAVLVVTLAADRMGGRIGGLLSTAPMTTTAALIHLAPQGDLGLKVAAGGLSLFSAIAAMPVYFFVLRWSRGMWRPGRIIGALLAYVAAFTGGTMALAHVTPPGLRSWWYVGVLLVVGLYAATFMQLRIDPTKLRGPKPPLTWSEGVARFGAGAVVILLVDVLGNVNPALGAAWAVFPGTFLVSLGVMGFGHGAAFSAKASQSGVLGGIPLAAFLVTYMVLVTALPGLLWAYVAMVPSWFVYFAALIGVQRVGPGGLPKEPPVRTPSSTTS